VRQDEGQGAGTTPADFVAGTAWADVAAQSHEAKRSILNFFATAPGSSNDPAVTGALRALAPFNGAARLRETDWDTKRIIDDVWRLEQLADVASLMRK
jgi:hypothetical protein